MNIAMLSGASRSNGGLFYAVRWLSIALNGRELKITVFSPNDKFTQEDLPAWEAVPVHLYKSLGPLRFSFSLSGLLQKIEPDIVHCHGIWQDSQRIALQWQKKTRTPIIISPHGMLDDWAIKNSAWKKRLVGALFANESLMKATCIHALCQSEAESIRAYGLTNPIAIIPNGVYLPKIVRNSSELKVGNIEYRRILFLGRIHPKKGLAELIHAWQILIDSQNSFSKPCQLLIAGWDDGGHLKKLQQQATCLNISWTDVSNKPRSTSNLKKANEASLLFCGPIFGNEKDTLLKTVNAFILPSCSEGLPMSVLEAWSYQLPVIMTNFCNLPEGFKAEAALRIEPNIKSIAQGLEKFLSLSNSDQKTMGYNGRKLVEQKFTWNQIAQEMKAVYEWCLGGNKPEYVQELPKQPKQPKQPAQCSN